MAAKALYLKQFSITWATPHVDFNPGAARGLSRGEVVLGVNRKVQAFGSLTDAISARLRREKRQLDPPITEAVVNISNVASVDLAYYHPRGKRDSFGLYVPYWMDPLDLLDVPEGKDGLGALGLAIVEDFLVTVTQSLYGVPDFPADVFEAAMEAYRAAKMTVGYKPVRSRIEGTSLTGLLWVEDSPDGAAIWLAIKDGRKELFRARIGSAQAGLGGYALTFPAIVPAPDALEVHGIGLPHAGPVRIAYSEMPAPLAAALAGAADG